MKAALFVAGMLLGASLVAARVAPAQTSTPRPASAELPELETLLNENVVTTASKKAQSGSAAPGSSVIMTAEDLRRYGIHTLAEAVHFLSLGGLVSDANEVGARGLLMADDRGSHVLLLVNGHAINEGLLGSARFDRGMGIPLEMVDHIELVLGPGSVLYGSNAMFGVINVVTKSASSLTGSYLVTEAELVSSWRGGAGGGYEFQLFDVPAALSFGVEYFRQNGPDASVPKQQLGVDWADRKPWRLRREGPYGYWGGPNHGPEISMPTAFAQLRWGDFELNTHASRYHISAPLGFPRRLDAYASDYDDRENYETEQRIWVDAKQRVRLSTGAELTARAYLDSFEYRRFSDTSATYFCPYTGVTTCRRETLGVSRWAGAELQSSLNWLNDERLTTLIGVDGRVRYSGHKLDVADYDTGDYLTSSTSLLTKTDAVLGAYLQQIWQPVASFGVNAGLRMDAYSAFGHRVSPRAAVAYSPWPDGTLKAVYSEAFRAPTWYEADVFSPVQIKADRLEPETVRSLEVSFDQKLGAHRFTWGVFRSWWSDLIQLQTLTGEELQDAQRRDDVSFTALSASQFRNIRSIDSYGYNAGYEGSFANRQLLLGLNVTGAYSRLTLPDDSAAVVPLAPSLFGNARIAYELPGDLPSLALAARYTGKRAVDTALDPMFPTPPYAKAQLELRATISGPVPAMERLSYRISANYAATSTGAYTTGILTTEPLLWPVDRFRVAVGLQADF